MWTRAGAERYRLFRFRAADEGADEGRASESRPELTDDPLTDSMRLALREQLISDRVVMERQLAGLVRNFEDLVEAAELQPPDDEHDPDGTTAFDRAQVTSLALATRAHLV
ncbi:hypothetical protein BH24ACT1_BH24ACT1_12420 [soil metagenome]